MSDLIPAGTNESARLERKIDHLGATLGDQISAMNGVLTEIRVDLERRLSAMDAKQAVIDGVHQQLIVVGELRRDCDALKIRVGSHDARIDREARTWKWAFGVFLGLFSVIMTLLRFLSP